MTREWKPGDLAMVDWTTGKGVRRLERMFRTNETGWLRDDVVFVHDVKVRDAYPLVVIDPEDRRQIEQLYLQMWRTDDPPSPGSSDYEADVKDIQAALRSLVAPPKPDEPMGKWAIVIADGVSWCRAAWKSHKPWSRIGTDVFASWDEMDVTSVESEGVA